jgi:hypothetical protein
MPISMKATLFAFFISLAIFLTPEMGFCATQGTKIVTRIDTVTAVMKGGTLTVHVEGMASTPSLRGGQLLKRGQKLNQDGLLEYELVFNPPQKPYSGDTLKQVKVNFKDSSIPVGTKGVRIYAEYNEMNAMLPEPKKQEPAPKKQEPVVVKKEEPVVAKKEKPVAKKEEMAPKKEEQGATSQWWNPFHHKPAAPQVSAPPPVPKKQELVLKKKEPVVKKEEPVIAKKEKPTLKQEELAPKKQEAALKKEEKKSQWWNPFHHKPAPAQVNAPPPPKKEALVLKKKEPVVKKEEPVIAKKEKPTLKQEAATPKTEEKKSQWWNPFHRKPAASPVNAMPPESKKQEPALTKSELVVKKENPIVVKKEKPTLKQEELAPKKQEMPPPKTEEKKSQWWNPFHHKPTASPANATPLEPKKQELATKKKEPVVTKEKPAPKKEEAAPKKEETKKKSHWYWNPFHRKPDAESSDEAPR